VADKSPGSRPKMRYASSDLVSDPLTRSRSQSPITGNALRVGEAEFVGRQFPERRAQAASHCGERGEQPPISRLVSMDFSSPKSPAAMLSARVTARLRGSVSPLINRTTKPAALTSVMTVAARTIQTCRFTLSATFSIFACSLRS